MTDAGTQLRRTIAEFYQVEEGQVGPAFSLAARQGSIARAALDAAIRRRVGLKSRAVYSARTFGELAAELGVGADGEATVPIPASAASASTVPIPITPPGVVACGVDIELLADLPIAADPWEDSFYKANFSPSEIAYCLRQGDPTHHFAARWCVKEALRKCDRAFLVAEGKDVEVAHDEAGAPHLVHLAANGPRRLPHAVSLSHTAVAAIAVVVRVDDRPTPVILPPREMVAPASAGTDRPVPVRRGGGKLALLLQLATLVVAALALYRTFPGR